MIESPKSKRTSRVPKYKGAEEESTTKTVNLVPWNDNQKLYIEALKTKNQIIVLGPSGCKTGDTIVWYNRGKRHGVRPISLRDFVEKFNGVKGDWDPSLPTYVHSFKGINEDITLNKVEAAWVTGFKEVLKITTDNSGFVKITKDDKVLLEDGSFKVASEILVGDKLLCMGDNKLHKTGRSKGKKTKQLRTVIEGLRFYEGGWSKKTHCSKVDKTYYYKRNHKARLVYEAYLNNTDFNTYVEALKHNPDHTFKTLLSRDYEVHHKDEDVTNDSLDNLVLMSKADHAKLHYEDRGQSNFGRRNKVISTVVSVEDLGVLEVFDLTMQGPHTNFVVNDGIVTHNTGKTYVAATMAANMYINRKISKIIITRPAVSVGKSLGALPGDIGEKFGPWLSPVISVLEEQLGKGVVETGIKNDNIQMAPLEYMRGSSFHNAFILADECQNLDVSQFKMLVTRVGENCKIVMNGDIRQSDIKEQSGLSKALHLAKKYAIDASIIEFGLDDVVRSETCKQWLSAFYEEGL